MTDAQQSGSSTRPPCGDLLAEVRAFQRGREDSFEILYHLLWGPVAARASRMGLADHDSEEIAQKTLVRVYLKAGEARFDRIAQVWGWVYKIATHEVYKLWRRRRPDLISPEALEVLAQRASDPVDDPSAVAASAEMLEHVRHCLVELAEAERVVLAGVLVAGLTFREAARAHDLTLGQFKHRYEKALAKVRGCLRAKGHEID